MDAPAMMAAPTMTSVTDFLLHGAGWLAAGAALGVAYFGSLRWSVQMFAAGRALAPLGLHLARFAALAALLALVARGFGALPLLVATAGVLMARTIVVGWERRDD
jgi:F1F0 ATPase subunit 2